eukprot:6023843-Lingulodinium_polyedra.AAC.1
MIVAGDSQAALDELSQVAHIIWSKVYGPARQGAQHAHRRQRQTRQPMAGPVAAFRQNRRATVDTLVENARKP